MIYKRKLQIGDRVIPNMGTYQYMIGKIVDLEDREQRPNRIHIHVDFAGAKMGCYAENELKKEGQNE